ncbi:SRF-type transcription factor (DNA-binding and dimerization domain)-domain-containing protein [Powellomyces hirtus]|nr:SRF-type transcription factor (DNA-binding and dimerization domain)-domain-containing protein [Powellomyces hirtus]
MSGAIPNAYQEASHQHQVPGLPSQMTIPHPDALELASQLAQPLQGIAPAANPNPLKRGASAASLSEHEDQNDDDNSDDEGKGKGRQGRRKIKIEYIDDKSRRHITFSKRKAGIMKKAYELSTLTGTQVLLLVASETGHVYTFATPKLQPLITKPEGKNLIQACLNAPDPNAPNTVVYANGYAQHAFQGNSPPTLGQQPSQPHAYPESQQAGDASEAAAAATAAIYQAEKQHHASQHAATMQQYAMQNVGAMPGYAAAYPAPAITAAQVAAAANVGNIAPYMYPYQVAAQNQYGGLVGTQQQQQQQEAQTQAHGAVQPQSQTQTQDQQQAQQTQHQHQAQHSSPHHQQIRPQSPTAQIAGLKSLPTSQTTSHQPPINYAAPPPPHESQGSSQVTTNHSQDK